MAGTKSKSLERERMNYAKLTPKQRANLPAASARANPLADRKQQEQRSGETPRRKR